MRRLAALALSAVLAGCSGKVVSALDGGTPPDSGATLTDAGADAGTDGGGPPGTDAGSDAGTPPGDAGTDGGCTAADFICDDFEADALGAAPAGWGVTISPADAGDIAVDNTRAHSGNHSLHIRSTLGNVGNSLVQIRQGLSLASNAYYGRFWLWMQTSPSPRHWDLIDSWGHLPGTPAIPANEILYQYGGSVQIGSPMLPDGGHTLSAYYLSQSTDCEQSSLGFLTGQTWQCVEWQFDGINNQMAFWLDGQSIPGLTVTDPRTGCGGTWTAPTFERLDLGWYNAPAENGVPREMWIDDVAASLSRVGCGP